MEITERKLQELLESLDDELYPELCTCLVDWRDSLDSEWPVQKPYFYATQLQVCDAREELPEQIGDLVKSIYLQEIRRENAEAMLNLGALYYTGRAGEQNYKKAVQYYTMAADRGNAQAVENLGYCWYYGRTGTVDYEKAFHCFVKGALAGRITSRYKMGDLYRYGYYVEKDEKLAAHIYQKCYNELGLCGSADNCADVCMRMGDVYYYGIGERRDLKAALRYYQESERYFYTKIADGDYFAPQGLQKVLRQQARARDRLRHDLPSFDWANK